MFRGELSVDIHRDVSKRVQCLSDLLNRIVGVRSLAAKNLSTAVQAKHIP